MIFEDFHIHSTFSDGNNTPEEIIINAINNGLKRIGISDHSYTPFDESYCLKEKDVSCYISEIDRLKKKYSNEIEIFCGIEQDIFSGKPTYNFDYVIGSVHYLKVKDNYIPVDETEKILINTANEYFDGDMYSLIDCYYETVADVVEKTNADVIGHFDLITKFNENNNLFDMYSSRYLDTAKKAIDKLLTFSRPFEINTGAVSRGYRSSAYPNYDLIKYIVENGGKLILSSDSHSKEAVMFEFEKYFKLYGESIIKLDI